MNLIDTFNSAVSDAINKQGAVYEAVIGAEQFTPSLAIVQSSDFNCGAICNELEFARAVSNYYVGSISVDGASGDELDAYVTAFIDLPRRGLLEDDTVYRARFKACVTALSNARRTTKWAILDALSYLVTDRSTVSIVEKFDLQNLYFEVRIVGEVTYTSVTYINSLTQGFINNSYVAGISIGSVASYVGSIVQRIKAGGVGFAIVLVSHGIITKTSDARIGSVQKYIVANAVIKNSSSLTITSNAVIA